MRGTSATKEIASVKRLPTFLHVLVCAAAAAIGAAVFGIAAAAALVLFQVEREPFSTIFFFGSIVSGLVGGVLFVRRRRKWSEERLRSSPADFLGDNASPFAAEMTDPQIGASRRSHGKWWSTLALLIGLIVTVSVCSFDSLQLRVSVTPRGLEIVNVGSMPTKVIDVIVNGRDDCSTIEVSDPSFSKDYLHKIWVANGYFMYVGVKDGKLIRIGSDRVLTTDPITLKSGDSAYWVPRCMANFVNATITTERGTATYYF
jgi:hypothetical protein